MNYTVEQKQFMTLYTIAETMLESGSSDARMGGRMVLDILIDIDTKFQKEVAAADRYWDEVAEQYDRDIAQQNYANGVNPINHASTNQNIVTTVDGMMDKFFKL